MKKERSGIQFGIIVSSRNFFPKELAKNGRDAILEKMKEMGFGCIILSPTETPLGVVETYQDAKKCADLFAKHREEIDGIIIVLPNFGDEAAVTEAIVRSGLRVPVLVQACDDEKDKLDLSHRRDSFCGKLSVCNNLYQNRIPFTDTTYHTCSIDSREFTLDVENFAGICKVVKGLKNLRVGAIGARPSAFRTVRYSEKLLQEAGITVETTDLSVILALAGEKMKDSRVRDVIESIRRYGNMAFEVSEEKLRKQAGFFLAVQDWLEENDCQASAIQCWDSLEKNYGIASCLAMSMMGEMGMPSACEMDIMGAVSMAALNLASGKPSGYLDWNNGFADNRDRCMMIHCANYPKSFLGMEPEIGNLDILSLALGEENCFGACKGVIVPGPFTFAKISTDDFAGRIKAYVGEGEFVREDISTPGGPGVVEIKGMQKLMKYICQNGFEHHVAMNRSHTAEILKEAFEKYMGWEVYHHE